MTLGVTRQACTARHERICQLRREGLMLKDIAERVELSVKMVQRVLMKNKIYRVEVHS